MQSMDIHLSEQEMKQLNRMVTSYLDFAEDMAERKIPLTMVDWEKRLNTFIEMFEYGLLKDAGKVSAEIAKLHAETEFEKYRIIQDKLFMSDFDRFILELESKHLNSDKKLQLHQYDVAKKRTCQVDTSYGEGVMCELYMNLKTSGLLKFQG